MICLVLGEIRKDSFGIYGTYRRTYLEMPCISRDTDPKTVLYQPMTFSALDEVYETVVEASYYIVHVFWL
jgi:hypothetical protein